MATETAGALLAATSAQAAAAAGWLHVGVPAVGFGGVLGWVRLPRGGHSGGGLVLMAVSMLVLAAAGRWVLGWWATAVMAASFLAGLVLVVGPTLRPASGQHVRGPGRSRDP